MSKLKLAKLVANKMIKLYFRPRNYFGTYNDPFMNLISMDLLAKVLLWKVTADVKIILSYDATWSPCKCLLRAFIRAYL